jgi:tetratricopeptide (TPR) repeat protein
MEAMASSRPATLPYRTGKVPVSRSAARLWQVPLLLFSLALFGYAAYLFIDPKPGLSIDQKVKLARTYLIEERPDAAIEQLNKLLGHEKLDRLHEGQIHMMLAEAISVAEIQKDKKVRIPRKNEQIIEQTELALANDIPANYEIHRRLAESYEALHNISASLKHYYAAMAMDPGHSLRMHRKIIDLHLNHDDADGAATALDQYIARKELADSERSWALCESAHLRIDHGSFADARALLADAARLCANPVDQGQINFWQGYCSWKLGDADDAERYLRLARDEMHTRHPLDGDACYVLGKIAEDKKDWKVANSFYEVVIVDHPDSRFAPLSRLGRGVCRIAVAQDAAGLTDLHNLTSQLAQDEAIKTGRAKYQGDVVNGLKIASDMLTVRGNYQGALELLSYEQSLQPELPPTFFARLGNVYEKRADQVQDSIEEASVNDQMKLQQQARDLHANAGDAYIAYSHGLTLADDKGYGESLWRGIDQYDRAGDLRRKISALKVFISERPNDSLAPDALLKLGEAYQAMGAYDDAIAAFQKNLFSHATALAASKSAVPLAQCYIAKGPEFYGKAEKTLADVLGNPLITPEAAEFRQSLFDLAQLYYRTNRFEDAVSKLEELTQRYPQDDKMGQMLFLMADSYRKSAYALNDQTATTRPSDVVASVDPTEAIQARRQRLAKARQLYDRVINAYRLAEPHDEVGLLYQKLSHFYRADCAYDLSNYAEAIQLYDTAAFRYQDDPSALSAFVQIVNSNYALGKLDEARTANERAKVLLKKMPANAFADGSFSMPKAYWQDWLKWTGESGIWK